MVIMLSPASEPPDAPTIHVHETEDAVDDVAARLLPVVLEREDEEVGDEFRVDGVSRGSCA